MGNPPSRPTHPKGKGEGPEGWWNSKRRPRGEYLTRPEVDALVDAAGRIGRYPRRDAAIIWVAFVHGLRVGELANLVIEQYDFRENKVVMNREKRGKNTKHPVDPREKRQLKGLIGTRRIGPVFLTERLEQFTASALHKIVARAGREAADKNGEPLLNFPVHFHMLRHSCGFWLNEQGHTLRQIQDYLGHKNPRHTERYTALSDRAFDDFHFD